MNSKIRFTVHSSRDKSLGEKPRTLLDIRLDDYEHKIIVEVDKLINDRLGLKKRQKFWETFGNLLREENYKGYNECNRAFATGETVCPRGSLK